MLVSLLLAGVFSLPALLCMVIVAPIVSILSIPSLALLLFRKPPEEDTTTPSASKHAIITGGSSGIGLSVAKACVQKGFTRVTVLARNENNLAKAKATLLSMNKSTRIETVSVCVTDPKALSEVAKKVCRDDSADTSTYLFCCAGRPYPSTFGDVTHEVFADLSSVNHLGVIATVQAFMPLMKRGTIVMTSSMSGQVGVYGYTAYAPTKFALRGFAEVLHIELSHLPIHVQVSYPPDTNTPGFEEEEKMKPIITRLVSENAGLADPDDIGRKMMQEAVRPNPRFSVFFNFEGWMLSALTAGMSPVSSLSDAVVQVALMGVFRFVSLFYLNDWWRIIRNEEAKTPKDAKKTAYGSVDGTDEKEKVEAKVEKTD